MQVAILLATYNSEKYLSDLLDSIFLQSYKDYKLYIHDDGSLDGTLDIIEQYKRIHYNQIVVLNYHPTGSAKNNFMSMLNYVSEDYVMFCDHDDIWKSDKIEMSLNKIKEIENKGPALVFGDMTVVDEELKIINPSFMNYTGLNPYNTTTNKLLITNVVPGCTIIMNRKLYKIVMTCIDTSNIRMHDQWCALVASGIGNICYLNQSLLLYRQHNDNVKGATKSKRLIDKALYILKRIITNSFFKENHEWHAIMRAQALELSKIEGLPEQTAKMCLEFAELSKKNKFQRIEFLLKHGITRDKDNWWFLLWA